MPRRSRVVVGVLLGLALPGITGGVARLAAPKAGRLRLVTHEELQSTFARDTRNLRLSWGGDDPRSERSRQDRLFEFVYQGYDSSAWVPQALFDGNFLTKKLSENGLNGLEPA